MMRRVGALLLAQGLAILIVLPVVALLLLSLARSWTYPQLWPTAWQFDQWRVFGTEGAALAAATLSSISLALGVALLATGAGFFTSYVLTRAHRAWLALALLPFAMPPVIYALSLGQAYAALGLNGHYGGVLLAQLPFAYGYAVLLCRGYWTRPRLALGELAASLGAPPTQVWWRVHRPLASGLLGMCAFQTALMSWCDFALVRIIGAGHVETLSLRVFDYFRSGDLRQAAAAALLMLVPPAVALLANPRLLWPALTAPSP